MSLLWPYTSDGRVDSLPLPIFEENISYEVECMFPQEDRGSYSHPKILHLIKWLKYALDHTSWKLKNNLSVEVLKKY